jgi:hypothetical protein
MGAMNPPMLAFDAEIRPIRHSPGSGSHARVVVRIPEEVAKTLSEPSLYSRMREVVDEAIRKAHRDKHPHSLFTV